MTHYLGIDIGTTRTKVAVLDEAEDRLVALRHRPTVVINDRYGGHRDANQLLADVWQLVDEVGQDIDLTNIRAVSVCSMGEEVVLLDDAGRVTGEVLAWHASHGREAKSALPDLGDNLAGLDDTFSVFKIAWLAQHRPAELRSSRTFTSVADFVARALLGDSDAPVFLNVSLASRTGLLDIRKGTLDGELLERVGAEGLRLPSLVGSGTFVGRSTAEGRLPPGIIVVAGGHDHFCSAFGAGVRSPGDCYVSAGTSEAQFVLVEDVPELVSPDVDVGIFVADGLRYIHSATPSGRYYQAWHDLLYHGLSDEAMWREVGAVAGDVTPAVLNPERRSITLGPLPMDVGRGHVMASLQLGLAANADATTTKLEQLADTPIRRVTVAGVAATAPVWRHFRTEATLRKLEFVTEPEATVLGVARLARYAMTEHSRLNDPDHAQEQP